MNWARAGARARARARARVSLVVMRVPGLCLVWPILRLFRRSQWRPQRMAVSSRARAMKTVPDCVPNSQNCVPKWKIVSLVVVCVPIVSQNESSRFVESSPIRVFSVSILSRGHFCVPILQKFFYVLVSGFSCISGYFRTFID